MNTDDIPSLEHLCYRLEEAIRTANQILPYLQTENGIAFQQVHLNLVQIRLYFIQYLVSLSSNTTTDAEWLLPSTVALLAESANNITRTGARGRPKYKIPEAVLINLRNMGNSWTDIANMLLVSRWTIHRRIQEYGIQEMGRFSNVSDDELNNKVRLFLTEHGNFIGFSMVYGYLQSIGLRIQQSRVRRSLAQVDPENSRLRWAMVVSRRAYAVRAPNSLWHIDGHHSLVSWGFVIHGCIDGYSRMIIYLHCASNNRSETVGELFQQGIHKFGLPSRVRTDCGGENVLVWEIMEHSRGINRGSALRGTSTQNQRIERLWRDVFRCVACNFYYLFQSMEINGLLDRSNPEHMYVLHFIYKDRINKCLDSFVAAWNRHPMRTERNWSPKRMWQNGMIDIRNRNLATVQSVVTNDNNLTSDDLTWYGHDSDAPMPTVSNIVTVADPIAIPQEQQLRELIDPLSISDNMGIDIFIQALEIVRRLNVNTFDSEN